MLKLADEIERGIKSAKNAGKIPAFRLNGTSDIVWEKIRFGPQNQTIFEMFPDVEFYDYTKIAGRKANPDENYSLTFSRSEDNEKAVAKAMNRGQNVAVVFGEELPETWRGPNGERWDVLDGDESDLRFLDPPRSDVGLKQKDRVARTQQVSSFMEMESSTRPDLTNIGERQSETHQFWVKGGLMERHLSRSNQS